MFFSQMISTSLLAMGAFALPSSLKARNTCSYAFEPSLNTIASQTPYSGSTATTSPFIVWNQDGKTDLVANFTGIPSTAYGCTLQFNYAPNPQTVSYVGSGDPTRIDVYSVSPNVNSEPITWNTIGDLTGSLVGTWHFPTGSALSTAEIITINSFVCQETMSFRFTVSDPNAIGGFTYPESASTGLSIQYSC